MTKGEQLKTEDDAFREARRTPSVCSVTYSDLDTDPGSVTSKTAATLETTLSLKEYCITGFKML